MGKRYDKKYFFEKNERGWKIMRKIFLFLLISLMVISFVFAANENAGAGVNSVLGAGNSENQSIQDNSKESVVSEIGSENGSSYEHQVATQTANKGESSQLKIETNSEFGSTIKSQNGSAEAKTEMKMSQGTDGKSFAELSNGMKAEIKIMPNTASEKALEVLGAKCEETGCEIELKEVGKGEESKAVYEIQAKKPAKILGLFKVDLGVEAQIDAETGEIIKTKKRWWAFLASE